MVRRGLDGRADAGPTGTPVAVLSGEAPAGDVESWFAERSGVPAALCRQGGRDLLLLQTYASAQLSGRIGFGRALLARHGGRPCLVPACPDTGLWPARGGGRDAGPRS